MDKQGLQSWEDQQGYSTCGNMHKGRESGAGVHAEAPCPCEELTDNQAKFIWSGINCGGLKMMFRDIPGGPWDSKLPVQGAQVWSLVGELDPTCCK